MDALAGTRTRPTPMIGVSSLQRPTQLFFLYTPFLNYIYMYLILLFRIPILQSDPTVINMARAVSSVLWLPTFACFYPCW